MKRMLSILMALLLLWSLALPAAAAETASTLRLEKTEGTVKVSNASGKSVSITEGMRLYSGYTIATGKNSYAYVSLDSTKAVKLDASSKVEVQKSGKKLELMLISGELFFNVTAPVEKDESLNIRTSTMVTGVRGTSGWVEAVNRFSSNVYLLEGTLTVTSTEPVTGQTRQTVITGGQTATATLTGFAQPGSQVTLTVTTLQEKQVPGFVAVEVKKDPALQKKITALSPLSVPEIIGDAEERLEAAQAAADLAQEEIKKQVESINVEQAERTEQVFENPAAADDDDDGSGAPEVQSGIVIDLDNPTAAQLNAALAQAGVTRVNVTDAGGDGSDLDTDSYSVRSGQTLNIQSGTFTIGENRYLVGDGTVNIYGTVENFGSIATLSTNSVHIMQGGTLNNKVEDSHIGIGGVVDSENGRTMMAGKLVIESGGVLNNDGIIQFIYDPAGETKSKLVNNGTLCNSSSSFNVSENDVGLFVCTGTYTEKRTDMLYSLLPLHAYQKVSSRKFLQGQKFLCKHQPFHPRDCL